MSDTVLVLGVGNPLMGDDGFGLAVLAELRDRWELADGVLLEDGGTWGMNLLPMVEDAGSLIVLDAIDSGQAPGTLIRLDRDQLPRYLGFKLSPHQVGLQEVFALCALRGTLPRRAVALGVQPARVALGLELSPPVQAALHETTLRVAGLLAVWGHPSNPREAVHA